MSFIKKMDLPKKKLYLKKILKILREYKSRMPAGHYLDQKL